MTDDSPSILNKVLDLLPDPVCVVDEQGRYVFVSPACERLLGYTQEELLGRNMIELVHPDDRERTLAAAAEIMDGEAKMHFQNRYVRKDGGVVHIMWSARWSEADRIRLAVARDITALKHAERMKESLYRISEAAHDADSLPDLYAHIHRIIADTLPADNFMVAFYDPAGDSLSFPYCVDEEAAAARPQGRGDHALIMRVIRTGEPLLTETDGDQPDWLGVPLISQGGIMGALVLKTCSGDVRYTGEDRELLQFVSTQVASAIERKQTESRLHHMAHHDPLTNLPNRTLFNDRFEMALKRARRSGEHLALLVLDLDDFKDINDNHGHVAGDIVLRQMSRRLEQCLRESDTIGRMGGDEFTVLLTNIREPEDATAIVDKIHTVFGSPFDLDGSSVSISASIGIAVYPGHGETIDRLFHHADAGMYSVKRGGA